MNSSSTNELPSARMLHAVNIARCTFEVWRIPLIKIFAFTCERDATMFLQIKSKFLVELLSSGLLHANNNNNYYYYTNCYIGSMSPQQFVAFTNRF